nr:MAG TPA: hypothetical protein [Caudoviricetes sp.]
MSLHEVLKGEVLVARVNTIDYMFEVPKGVYDTNPRTIIGFVSGSVIRLGKTADFIYDVTDTDASKLCFTLGNSRKPTAEQLERYDKACTI